MSRFVASALTAVLFLAVAGLFLAGLLLLHESDPAALGLVCGAAGSCQRVLSSRFSHFAGIPLAAFGAGFYASLIVLWSIILAAHPGRLRKTFLLFTLLLTTIAALISAGLLAIQIHFIQSLCPLCCTSAVDCFLLAAILFYLQNHDDFSPQPLAAAAGGILLGASAFFAAMTFWLPQHQIVGRVGVQTVTAAEMQSTLGKPLRQLEWQTYRMQHDWIQQRLTDLVLNKEAARLGISKEELIRRNVEQPAQAKLEHVIFSQTGSSASDQADVIHQQMYPHLRDQTYAIYVKDLFARYAAADYLPLPAITEDDLALLPGWHRGGDPRTARARLVIFSDFACEYCAQMSPTLDHIMQKFGTQVSWTFRYFPHDLHEHSREAAIAAECAGRQGKFWSYHDALMQHGGNLGGVDFVTLADHVGLNVTDFLQCQDDPSAAQTVDASRAQALAMGLDNTPAVFLNGTRIGGMVLEADLSRQITAILGK